MKPQKRVKRNVLIVGSVAFVVLAGAGLLHRFPLDGKMDTRVGDMIDYAPVYKWQAAGGAKAHRFGGEFRQKNAAPVLAMQNPYLSGVRTIQLFCKIDMRQALREQWRSAVCNAVLLRLEQSLDIPVEILSGARLPAGGDQGTFGVLSIEVNAALNENRISGKVKWATSIIMRGINPQEEGKTVTQAMSGDIQSDSSHFADKLVDTIPFLTRDHRNEPDIKG